MQKPQTCENLSTIRIAEQFAQRRLVFLLFVVLFVFRPSNRRRRSQNVPSQGLDLSSGAKSANFLLLGQR
jgi:hypothetical protein